MSFETYIKFVSHKQICKLRKISDDRLCMLDWDYWLVMFNQISQSAGTTESFPRFFVKDDPSACLQATNYIVKIHRLRVRFPNFLHIHKD